MEHRAEEKRRLFKSFKRFFPDFDPTQITKPARSELMATMHNIIQYAFEAYEDPKVKGFTENTSSGAVINHLNYELANDAVAGVLKIHLKEAKNVTDSDYGWGNLSEPFVVFTAGPTTVRSKTIENTKNPKWNSTHHVLIRKQYVKTSIDDKLHITLFDDDSHEASGVWGYIAESADRDDFLGTASIPLKKLKHSGVQHFELKLHKEGSSEKTGSTVYFSTEYVSFEEACKEMGTKRVIDGWLTETDQLDVSVPSGHNWRAEFGKIKLHPITFFNVPSTDTQAYVYVNCTVKLLLVAFRGTELTKFRDVLVDLAAYMNKFNTTNQSDYLLSETEALLSKDIRVHSGFLRAYESVREPLLQVLFDLTQWNEEWDICVTGHSLGGALATLCAFELSNRKNTQGGMPTVGVMTFGGPRVGNKAFAENFDSTVAESFRVVDQDDVIHLIPPLYTHTTAELLCRPDGDVYVDGELIEDFPPGALVNSREFVDYSQTGKLREIYSKYGGEVDKMANQHSSRNYYSLVDQAVRKFFSGAA